MITILADLPDNVLGAEGSGVVTGADYTEVLKPALETYLANHERARVLLVLGPSFTEFAGDAMWQDARLGLGNIKAWQRTAVVTDHAHLRGLVNTFAFTMPGEVRTFTYDQLADARAWVAA